MTDTNHTDSVEATTKEKAIAITVRLETEIFKGRFSSSTLEEIEQVLLEELTPFQATQSQQVEEAVERVAKAIYNEMVCDDPRGKPDWVPGGNSIKQDEARRKALQALTPNHQD